MTQFINKKLIVASLFCAPFLLTACGDDITEETVEQETQTGEIRWTRPAQQLVVDVPAGAEETRVVLVDNKETGGRGVSSSWETTDKVGVWNVTAATSGQNGYNVVNPNSNTKQTQFVGTVNCEKNDKIAMFYPYDGTGVTLDNNGILTISLEKQKGTLEDIAKNFDLVYGEATVSNVRNGEATASVGTLKSGITILEFQFQDSENNNAQIEFERVQIKIEGGHNTALLNLNKLSDGLLMHEPSNKVYDTIYVKPAQPTKKVYVALFGESKGKTFHFSIVDKFGFQHKVSTKAPASITAGQITRANLKSKKGDFIEIDDLKWTKGNLIWDCGNITTTSDIYFLAIHLDRRNYFVAPSQEWSPEQLTSGILTNMPCWPVAPPSPSADEPAIHTVPNPSIYDGYYGTFYCGIAGFNGETSARGRVITPGSVVPSGGSTQTVVQAIFPQDTDYRCRLWGELDPYLGTSVTLEQALASTKPTTYFFGDLPYLVSEGLYAIPTYGELKKIFEHPNACWGVVMVPDNGQNNNVIKMRVGTRNKNDRSLLPIYGLYVNKTKNRLQMENSNGLYVGDEKGGSQVGYKGCAVVLTAKDLEEGIFLPADGIRHAKFASGGLEFYNSYQPGEYCSYLVGTFGEGALLTLNARHWTARPINGNNNNGADGKADVEVKYIKEQRSTTGSIRPIFIGDIYK